MVARNKRFVYGTFYWPGKARKLEPPPPPFMLLSPRAAQLRAWDKIAIEIIREYSANELIGKLYYQGGMNQWTPIEPSQLADIDWYKWYKRISAPLREQAKSFYFDMEGSGRWAVLHFRNESDESGPYVAVALRFK